MCHWQTLACILIFGPAIGLAFIAAVVADYMQDLNEVPWPLPRDQRRGPPMR